MAEKRDLMAEPTDEEWLVIEHLRKMGDGLLYISVDDGQPYQLVELPLTQKSENE